MAKIDITPIPYKGGAPALADLIGGHIPATFNNIPESIAQVMAGTVRPLGVTTALRSPVLLPDVPVLRNPEFSDLIPGCGGVGSAPAGCRASSRRSSRGIASTRLSSRRPVTVRLVGARRPDRRLAR